MLQNKRILTAAVDAMKQWSMQRIIATLALVVIFVGVIFVVYRYSMPRYKDSLPTSPVTYQQIESYPEAQLVYPGAKVVRWMGAGETPSPTDGPNPAFYGAVLTSQDSPDKIYAWYGTWMKAHGWKSFEPIRATTQISIQGYKRGARERFTIAIDDPHLLERTLGHSLPSANTVFEYSYLIAPTSK